MTDNQSAILEQLANGEFMSGEMLAEQLGVSRAAVWKHIEQLRQLGVGIVSQQGKGYRLQPAFQPLRAAEIQRLVGDENCPVEVLSVIESTNAYLLANPPAAAQPAKACLAEIQTAGRGRRGRQWLSPPGSGLCLSLAWRFKQLPASPGSLSLAVGVWIVDALQSLGINGVQLKWPNDLYATVDGKTAKLGGVLVELSGELSGEAVVVIGIGINHKLPPNTATEIDREVTDISSLTNSDSVERDRIAGTILQHCLQGLPHYQQHGFAPYRQRWAELDSLKNAAVTLEGGAHSHGIARGVAEDGALLLDVVGQQHRIISGEVSLRAAV